MNNKNDMPVIYYILDAICPPLLIIFVLFFDGWNSWSEDTHKILKVIGIVFLIVCYIVGSVNK